MFLSVVVIRGKNQFQCCVLEYQQLLPRTIKPRSPLWSVQTIKDLLACICWCHKNCSYTGRYIIYVSIAHHRCYVSRALFWCVLWFRHSTEWLMRASSWRNQSTEGKPSTIAPQSRCENGFSFAFEHWKVCRTTSKVCIFVLIKRK